MSISGCRVSWLIPVRGGRPWLPGAVRSALAECQDDDEVIVIDDGSPTPWTPAELPTDPRLRLVHQPPRGIVDALEHGRRLATGRLLSRLDADDEAVPGRIEAQCAALAADPTLVVVGGKAEPIGAFGDGMARYVDWINGLNDHRSRILVESPLFHPAVLMRADAVAAVGGYREGDLPEDYDLWLRLVGAGGGIGAVDQTVVRLRDRADRLTRTDPRYRRSAFTVLKLAWAQKHLLQPGLRVGVWGAGRSGRPWRRLVAQGPCTLSTVVDVKPGGQRQGLAVRPWQDLENIDLDLLLVAVGVASARSEIRAALATVRPEWTEGVQWWAVC